MARIINSDIDALVAAAGIMKTLADETCTKLEHDKLVNIACHVRKVYILLLKSNGREVIDLKQLCFEGIANDPELEKAIDALCPNTG